MKQILLTRQNPLLPDIYTLVDDVDFNHLVKFTWYYYKYKRTAYAKTFIEGKIIGMHTLILQLTNPNLTVDHIDGDGLNNQRNNLRGATIEEQRRNKAKHLNSTSQYKGVSWDSKRAIWTAKIFIDNKQVSLGRFDEEWKAARAWNWAAQEAYGEFAKLNKIIKPQ